MGRGNRGHGIILLPNMFVSVIYDDFDGAYWTHCGILYDLQAKLTQGQSINQVQVRSAGYKGGTYIPKSEVP